MQMCIRDRITEEGTIIKANEIHALVRQWLPKRKIITLGIDDLWAADVMMLNYANQNDNYKYNRYILNVIDTFCKYVCFKIS